MRTPTLLAALLFAACSSSDPKTLTSEGFAALHRGDAKAALVKFDAALTQLDAQDAEYLRSALGRCEALARLAPAQAKDAFLALAKAQPAKVRENDYSLICDALLRSDATMEAIDVMHAGNEHYKESSAMKATTEAVMRKAKEAKSPDALQKLKGLGYT